MSFGCTTHRHTGHCTTGISPAPSEPLSKVHTAELKFSRMHNCGSSVQRKQHPHVLNMHKNYSCRYLILINNEVINKEINGIHLEVPRTLSSCPSADTFECNHLHHLPKQSLLEKEHSTARLIDFIIQICIQMVMKHMNYKRSSDMLSQ